MNLRSLVAAGITTSILLETILLHTGRDRLAWKAAASTALGMSLVSMLAMEVAENVVTINLTDSNMSLGSKEFWTMTGISILAGFVTPLPYNYLRLKLWSKSCH